MSLHDAMKPPGGATMQRVTDVPDPDDYLLKRILSRPNMHQAWKRVKANHGAAGVDGQTVDQFPTLTRAKWPEIHQMLLAGTYQPSRSNASRSQNLLVVFGRWGYRRF